MPGFVRLQEALASVLVADRISGIDHGLCVRTEHLE